MAIQASELLDIARLRAYPHLTLQRISDKLLVSRLSELDRRAYDLAAQNGPGTITKQGTPITLSSSLARNADGYHLGDYLRFVDFFYQDSSSNVRDLRIVTPREQYTVQSGQPAAVIRKADYGPGYRLFPVDPAAKNWDPSNTERWFFKGDGDKILWRYIPKHERLTSVNDYLMSPEFARSWLEESLLEFILYSVKQPLQDRDRVRELWHQYLWDLYNYSQQETNWSGWRHQTIEGEV